MVVVKRHSSCDISHSKGAACQQRAVGAILLVHLVPDAKHCATQQVAHDRACALVYPVLVDGILDKESHANYQHNNSNLAKEILANELLKVALLPYRLLGEFFDGFACGFLDWLVIHSHLLRLSFMHSSGNWFLNLNGCRQWWGCLHDWNRWNNHWWFISESWLC